MTKQYSMSVNMSKQYVYNKKSNLTLQSDRKKPIFRANRHSETIVFMYEFKKLVKQNY